MRIENMVNGSVGGSLELVGIEPEGESLDRT